MNSVYIKKCIVIIVLLAAAFCAIIIINQGCQEVNDLTTNGELRLIGKTIMAAIVTTLFFPFYKDGIKLIKRYNHCTKI